MDSRTARRQPLDARFTYPHSRENFPPTFLAPQTPFPLRTTRQRWYILIRPWVVHFESTDDRKPKVRDNVFRFGLQGPTKDDIASGIDMVRLILAKQDPFASQVMNMEGMRAFTKVTTESDLKRLHDLKSEFLERIGVTSQGELHDFTGTRANDTRLADSLTSMLPMCFQDFATSAEAADLAYSRLLLTKGEEGRKARTDFSALDKVNLFGDSLLIQNALFLNADILSLDKGVKKMAGFCRIRCEKTPSE